MSKRLSQPIGSWPRCRNYCFVVSESDLNHKHSESHSLRESANPCQLNPSLSIVQRARSSAEKGTDPGRQGAAPVGVYWYTGTVPYTTTYHILNRRTAPHKSSLWAHSSPPSSVRSKVSLTQWTTRLKRRRPNNTIIPKSSSGLPVLTNRLHNAHTRPSK